MESMRKTVIALPVFLLMTGCGTFLARRGDPHAASLPHVYPATYLSGTFVVAPWSEGGGLDPMPYRLSLTAVGIVDTPISLLTDTLCLPFDAFLWLRDPSQLTLEERRHLRDTDLRQQRESDIVEPTPAGDVPKAAPAK